jgi:hypothetical protein
MRIQKVPPPKPHYPHRSRGAPYARPARLSLSPHLSPEGGTVLGSDADVHQEAAMRIYWLKDRMFKLDA